MVTDEEGKFLLDMARKTIERTVRKERIEKPAEYPSALDENRGVFCTIEKTERIRNMKDVLDGFELRGCIGVPYPIKPLIESVMEAAESVCHDPRFPELKEEELNKIRIEISILTNPEPIGVNNPQEYLDNINEKDGLIIQYGPYSGLFLPQVWKKIPGKEQFLNNLCLKAGLSSDMWKEKETKLYKFHAQIFSE